MLALAKDRDGQDQQGYAGGHRKASHLCGRIVPRCTQNPPRPEQRDDAKEYDIKLHHENRVKPQAIGNKHRRHGQVKGQGRVQLLNLVIEGGAMQPPFG